MRKMRWFGWASWCGFLWVGMIFSATPRVRGGDDHLAIHYAEAADTLTVALVTWDIPRSLLRPVEADVSACDPLKLAATLKSADGHTDMFRFYFYPGVAAEDGDRVTLGFELLARAGSAQLMLALADCEDRPLLDRQEAVTIPAGPSLSGNEAGAEAPVHGLALEIEAIGDEVLLVGKAKVAAKVFGPGIAQVRYLLDGREVERVDAAKGRHFRGKVNLGREPGIHDLQADALAASGQVLATDRLVVNQGPHALTVRLLSPSPGTLYPDGGVVRARVRVDVPREKKLESIDFYLDDRHVATTFQEPYVMPIRLPAGDQPIPLRVVARLNDSSRSSDSLLLNAPPLEGLEVRNIELFVNVEDKRGLPVSGLERSAFSVFQDGKPQQITSFKRAADLPLHLTFLVDISGSMQEFLPALLDGARDMVTAVVRSKDRVSLYTFEDKAEEIVPFTGSSRDLLAGMDKVAEQGISRKPRGSAIYDGIIQALQQFQGIQGRRALLVFTDGFDNSSHFSLKDVSRFARAAEVRVYLFHTPPDASNLAIQLLPLDTGGGYYKVASPRHLAEFYRIVETELRTQYLVAFQTSREPGDQDCHKLKLELAVKDLRARTMRGWCP